MTKASFHLPEHPAQKKPKYSEVFRWTDANVYAMFRHRVVVGTCGFEGCRRDDPVVYAFPASKGLNPPPYHWQCFQKVMDEPTTRMFKHLTSNVYPKRKAKVTA